MADAVHLLIGGPVLLLVIGLGVVSVAAQIFIH